MTADATRREPPGGSGCDARYTALIRLLLGAGESVPARNGDCLRAFGESCTFSATPLVGVRRTAWRTALREMEWMLSGSVNLYDAPPDVQAWWEPFASAAYTLPLSYGKQFRAAVGWGGQADQIADLIRGLVADPYSRRHVVTTWNACDAANPAVKLPPCWGTVIQAFVSPASDALSLVTYQRSADVVCGLPHNWLAMWAFLTWLAHRTGREVGTLTWVGGDVHLYRAHEPLARRVADQPPTRTPGLVYAPSTADFRADDFALDGAYSPVITDRAEMVP